MKKVIEKLSPYTIYFILYAIIGWIYEVFLEVVIYKWGFSNRGVLFGPWLPVYGFGALLFLWIVYPIIKGKSLKQKLLMIPIVFILCMISATLLELLTYYLCEFFLGSWPWQTYKDYKYNFQARIALSPSIRFGIGGVVFLYLLQPLFEKITSKLKEKKYIVSIIIILTLIIDLIGTIISKIK